MLVTTQGFVLHVVNYSETSVIVKIFTRCLGVKSYIVKGVRSAKGRVRANLFQPLSFLDMVVYDNPKKSINFIKDVHLDASAASFGQHGAVNSALRFFMTELLYKTLREDEPNIPLFDYVAMVQGSSDPRLPISFLLNVAGFLGVEPRNNYSEFSPFFDLNEASFQPRCGPSSIDAPLSFLLHGYLDSLSDLSLCPESGLQDRIDLINILLHYYQLHVSDFKDFNSHDILHDVLR